MTRQTPRYATRISGRSSVDSQPLYSVYDTTLSKFCNYGIKHEDGSRSYSTRDLNEASRNVDRMNEEYYWRTPMRGEKTLDELVRIAESLCGRKL
jgi:hypothetical protein